MARIRRYPAQLEWFKQVIVDEPLGAQLDRRLLAACTAQTPAFVDAPIVGTLGLVDVCRRDAIVGLAAVEYRPTR